MIDQRPVLDGINYNMERPWCKPDYRPPLFAQRPDLRPAQTSPRSRSDLTSQTEKEERERAENWAKYVEDYPRLREEAVRQLLMHSHAPDYFMQQSPPPSLGSISGINQKSFEKVDKKSRIDR
jgi:hypothetical protein